MTPDSHDPPKPWCRRCQLSGRVPFPVDMPPPKGWGVSIPGPSIATLRTGSCTFLGKESVGFRECPTCTGRVRLKEFACGAGLGIEGRAVPTVDCGPRCRGYTPMPRWSYGVTTCSVRRGDLLPRTLESLQQGGFDTPHLFVDGDPDGISWGKEFGLSVTARGGGAVRTAGHWVLSLLELYLRDPTADRFAVFQDDLVCVRNLKGYLDSVRWPDKAYLNLYTFPSNQGVCKAKGWNRARALDSGPTIAGTGEGFQSGRGAVALCFTREAVLALFSQRAILERAQDPNRGWKAIDGGVVTAMNGAGYSEYVHDPSLVQHTGAVSSMGNRPHKLADSFPGEEFDAVGLTAVAG